MSIEQAIETRLKPVPAKTPGGWSVWEHKTLNMHRGVLHYRPERRDTTISELNTRVLEMRAAQFRVSWWRGFGFGVLVDIGRMPEDMESIGECIDPIENVKGNWQWIIVICDDPKAVIAMHTWVQGYLTPVYRGLLQHYKTSGYPVKSLKKEKGKLMRFLTIVGRSRLLPPDFEVDE